MSNATESPEWRAYLEDMLHTNTWFQVGDRVRYSDSAPCAHGGKFRVIDVYEDWCYSLETIPASNFAAQADDSMLLLIARDGWTQEEIDAFNTKIEEVR